MLTRTNMLSFLTSLVFTASALAADLQPTFSQVHRENLTGLAHERDAEKIRRDTALYAFYRRYPKGQRGQEIWQNCYENQETHFFCEMILVEREKALEQGTDKEKRKRFFDALLTLDDESLRAKNCPAARKTLNSLATDSTAASLHARVHYWLWVCAKALHDPEEAKRTLEILSQRFPVAHHTLLALQKDEPGRLAQMLEDADWPIQFRSQTVPEINPYIAGIEAAMEQKEDGAAAVLGLHINVRLQSAEPAVRIYLASLMSRVSASIPSVLPVGRVLVPLFQGHTDLISRPLLKILFPDDYVMLSADAKKSFLFRDLIEGQRDQVDADLLAGLMHQESALNPRASSTAGAYGLTQMLIGTANDQWRAMSGDPQVSVTSQMLLDPVFAVKVGAADLRRRINSFSGNRVLAIASYNAGETGVKNWLKEVRAIKDPQILADILFMNRTNGESHVPQYVSAVLSKAFWYSSLHDLGPPAP